MDYILLLASLSHFFKTFECHVTGVYAPNCNLERENEWEETGVVTGLLEGPWAVSGDFNVTKFPSEQ